MSTQAEQDGTPPPKLWRHTRHIPAEHLDFSTEMAQSVSKNGLCDVLKPDSIQSLKSYGIDTVELRLVWWEFEPEPGRFDWSRFERDLETVEAAGLHAGLMAWLNHPPAWYHRTQGKAACFQCLEHERETTTLSLWDPETLKVKERLYRIIAERYGARLDFVYLMFSGDYGEPVLPQGVRHYRFSSPHSHSGIFWSGDGFARTSWRDYLRGRYTTLDAMNAAWNTSFRDWGDDLLEGLTQRDRVNRLRRLDYMDWITASTAGYAREVYKLIRRHFPKHRTALPIGHCSEASNGQWKSLCVQQVASHDPHFTARWTGMAVLGEFSKSNVLANRVSSMARLYGTDFGEEAALIIQEDNAAAAFYEGLANGMSMLHNDIGNIQRAGTVSTEWMDRMTVDPPETPVALFYPSEQEMIEAFEEDPHAFLNDFTEQAAELRHRTNYEIGDWLMIQDGFLDHKEELIFVTDSVLYGRILPKFRAFLQRGGRITLCNEARISLLESGELLQSLVSPVTVLPGLPCDPDYETLRRHPGQFATLHRRHVSRFDPVARAFTVDKRTDRANSNLGKSAECQYSPP